MIQPKSSAVVVVAGDRSGFDSRQHEDELISLGVWRINMLKSMRKYVDQIAQDLEQTENGPATLEVGDGTGSVQTSR